MTLSIATNGKLFRAAMQNKAANLKIGQQRRIIVFAKTLHQTLVATTPILTGKAKAEWQIALNEQPTQELMGRQRPPTLIDYGAYAQAAEAALDTYASGDTIYITSVIPYIEYLNGGASQQAPAGFVEDAIATSVTELRATV